MAGVPTGRGEDTDTRGRGHVTMEVEVGVTGHGQKRPGSRLLGQEGGSRRAGRERLAEAPGPRNSPVAHRRRCHAALRVEFSNWRDVGITQSPVKQTAAHAAVPGSWGNPPHVAACVGLPRPSS